MNLHESTATHRLGPAPRRSIRLRATVAALAVAVPVTVGVAVSGTTGSAAFASTYVRDDRISDLSGVASSTYDRDLMWTVGGSGNGPTLLGVRPDGSTAAHVAVTGATNNDWQDVAPGPDHTLWIVDVNAVRHHHTNLTVYRTTEPSDLAVTAVPTTVFRLRLPQASGAVSLLVKPVSGRVFVATHRASRAALYAAPRALRSAGVNRLSRVAPVPADVTGGSFGTTGRQMVLVDDHTAYLYDGPDATSVTTQPLPAQTVPTGLSIARSGQSLLVSSDEPERAIFTIPIGHHHWPHWHPPALPFPPPDSSPSAPSAPSPTAPDPTTPAPTPPSSAPPSVPPSSGDTTPPASDPATPGAMGIGMYSGAFSYDAFEGDFGSYPAVETTYLNADQVTTPNLSRHEAQIDRGISPVITLDYKNGPFTREQIAAWGSDVQSYYKTFVGGLKTLSDYAAKADNGTRVYFADEHEAQIKINQDKYAFTGYGASQKPTTAQSAAAWDQVMGYVRSAAPDVVRTYWYGGSGANESTYASLLDPSLIQMATFDPYRWRHDSAGDTPQELWGSMISTLKSQSWMKNADGSLKPWGLTEWGTDESLGDASNAVFVSEALAYLREQGASFAVYFNRVDGNDDANDFVITDGSQPLTLAAFLAASLLG